jgi:DNA-binding NarL/FixJ family response regulator
MNRSTELTDLETMTLDLYKQGYTQSKMAEEMNVSEGRITAMINKIMCKILYKIVLETYHLPKEMGIRTFMLLYKDKNFAKTLNTDDLNLKRYSKNLQTIILEGERY